MTLLVITAVAVAVFKAGEADRALALTIGTLVLVGLFVWRNNP